MEPVAFGRRAILKKEGADDVRVEVYQNGGSFSCKLNGVDGPLWRTYSPQQLMRGDTPRMTLEDAWHSVLSKYPGYSVTEEQEAFPVESAK